MADIETLTEEERGRAEEAISEVEDSERVLLAGTDVGRPELAAALRKMQAAYMALVVERSALRMRIVELETLLADARPWLDTHDERVVIREFDTLCDLIDGALAKRT